MRLKRVSKFIKPLTKKLLPTQQAVLSQVVCGMLTHRGLILAQIARGFETRVAFVHNLKRVFRFVSNPRLHEQRSKELVAARMIQQLRRRLRHKPQQYLEVILDWTSVGDYEVLSALIGVRGRAVPVLQWAIRKWEFEKSQNALEEQFLRSLRRAIPPAILVVLVADRGFGRTDLFQFLDELGFHYVIRVKGDAYITHRQYHGPLRQYPLSLGQTFKLTAVRYQKKKQYRLKLALTCARIKGKTSAWLLATQLPLAARQIVDIYRRRFWCEESFRDQKQAFALEAVRVQEPERLANLLLALALVFLILAVLGLRAEKLGYAAKFAGRKKGKKVISWVTLALRLLSQSTKYLNLLFEVQGCGLSLHWV